MTEPAYRIRDIAIIFGSIAISIVALWRISVSDSERESRVEKQFFSVFFALFITAPITAYHLSAPAVVVEIEGTVFTDQTANRPHPGNVITPASRPAGNGNHFNTCLLQPFHGIVSNCRQFSVQGQGVINISQHISDLLLFRMGKTMKWSHHKPGSVMPTL